MVVGGRGRLPSRRRLGLGRRSRHGWSRARVLRRRLGLRRRGGCGRRGLVAARILHQGLRGGPGARLGARRAGGGARRGKRPGPLPDGA